MDNELQAKLAQRMQELPVDVRDAIISADFGRKVQAIGTKHQLHIDQIGTLEDEVLLVMLAFSEAEEFVPSLVEQLHVSEDVANIIADEVSNDILAPIRHSMQEFMEVRAARNMRDILTESLDETPLPEVVPLTPTQNSPLTPPLRSIPFTPLGSHIPMPPAAPRSPTAPAKPSFQAADAMLAGKTVMPPSAPMPITPFTTAATPPPPPAPTQPQRDYKTDPYHEPV